MTAPKTKHELTHRSSKVKPLVEAALAETGGLLQLAPCWVPRSFLQPGKRLKLHPDDLYAFGLSRGGIDERWFASTTEAANDNRTEDEGLSYVVVGHECFTLRDAVAECGAELIGSAIWEKYGKWPVYSKFFDNMGPIPHHMHQDAAQAALVGQEGKPESYYFPPQHNDVGNNFPYTFMGFEPGATCTIKDKGAYGLICVQGSGTINGQVLNSPKLIRFHELTGDEYLCTEAGAKAGVTFTNTSITEPLVCLRYFGPEVNPDAPAMGAYKKG